MKTLLAALLPCLPILAHADCMSQSTQWAQALQPGRSLNKDLAVCKVSPGDSSQTFAVLPFAQKGATGDAAVYDLEVVIADSRSNAIIAHLMAPSAYTSDAFMLQPLTLDTARYQVTPALRAFGVRASFEGSSRANPAGATSLDLYVLDGRTLRRVLTHLEIAQNQGEWDENCTGTSTTITRTLQVDPTARHGYADLSLIEKTVDSADKTVAGDCRTIDQPAEQGRMLLRYDGKEYAIPKALQFDN